jgi:hypothetical protein
MLSGKKTYLIAALMVVFNGLGWYLDSIGQTGIPQDQAIQGLLMALGLAGLRAGVAKNGT